jgi:hypothetical protein
VKKVFDINSPEGKRLTKKFVDDWVAKEKAVTSYFETPEFNAIFERLIEYLKNHKSVCTDTDYDQICFEDITDEQIDKLTNSIFNNCGFFREDMSEWSIYKGIRFEIIHGQGSFISIHVLKKSELIGYIKQRKKAIEEYKKEIRVLEEDIERIGAMVP